ncbi:MAG: vanadium-dependent haloperoxidase [Acidobacteriota bacterium]|nr:vanadium-dependent haloperoxidase [Acidobacteriota bacterium]
MRHAFGFAIAAALALGAGAATAAQAGQTSDDVVLQWNDIAVTTIGAQPPFPSTRFMATVQLAVFEAVNAITGKYEPYLATITAPPGASTEAAAITAAHGVLRAFFSAAAITLDQQRDASLALIPAGQAKTDGTAIGEAVAAAMVAERTGDGSTPSQFYLPTHSDPYEWQRTPSCPTAGGAFFHWGNVKPFGVLNSSQFRADPPPALTSDEYARDFNEVLALGDINSPNRSEHNANVARIYANQPPHQGWNSVARQIINTRDDDITDTARTLALMNMSLADAHITVFESKYFYRTWRPETAIPRAAEDGNPDTAPSLFTPFIRTPCFPGYPSAHGVGAGAASRVLWKAYGRHHTVTNSHPSVPGVVLTYDDLLDIVKDVSDARVYGGIHFLTDQDAGEHQGKSVAQWNLVNHLRRR